MKKSMQQVCGRLQKSMRQVCGKTNLHVKICGKSAAKYAAGLRQESAAGTKLSYGFCSLYSSTGIQNMRMLVQ